MNNEARARLDTHLDEMLEKRANIPKLPDNPYECIDAAVELMRKEAANKLDTIKMFGGKNGDILGKVTKLMGKTKGEKALTAGSLVAGGAAGYGHYKAQPEDKKNLLFPAITALGTAWSLNPRYLKRTYDNVKHARSIPGADTQAPVVKALGTSAALMGGSGAVEAGVNTAQNIQAAGENIRKTTDVLAVKPENDINVVMGDIRSSLKDVRDFDINETVREGAGEVVGGVLQGAKDTGHRALDWMKANPGKSAAVGGATVATYALYKYLQNRSERKDTEEDAEIQAKAMAKAMRGVR